MILGANSLQALQDAITQATQQPDAYIDDEHLPVGARIDYTPGPASIKPEGPPLDYTPGYCWDCRCPMTVPVYRPGTDQAVCRDCRDYHHSEQAT